MGDKEHYKAKCVELEEIVELSLGAFRLIPTDELRKDVRWFPSKEALSLIEQAKNAALMYSIDHWGGN